jgi:protein-S-isoprenylcysteine O-methyltransferase Ste14
MHGKEEVSKASRVLCTLMHAVLLSLAAWIYFGDGGAVVFSWLSLEDFARGDVTRHAVLFAFGVVLFLRMFLVHFYLLKRRFGWDEFGGVVVALIIYQVIFALLGVSTRTEIGIVDVAAVIVFVLGSYLNTGSELQRKRFKDNPANKRMLYTGGLFRLARHINYFGDILWVTAWAVVTRNIWSAAIPVALTLSFIFSFIPNLSKYLKERYGEQYEEWARTTKKLIPFVY